MTTNQRIAKALANSGLTRSEFAAAMGVSIDSLNSWLTDRRTARESMARLAESISKAPFPPGIRDDWQCAGASGPRTKARAKAMRKPPFAK